MRKSMARAKKEDHGHPETSEDRFVEGILQAGTWLQHHARTAILLTIGIAAVLMVTLYYRDYRQTVRERAAVELESLRGIALTDPAGASVQLESFVNQFQGTQSAEEGRLVLAGVLLGQGRISDAIAALEAAQSAADTPSGYGAKVMLAAAYEEAGDLDAALDVLNQLGTGARYPFQQREARVRGAQIMRAQGRLAESAAVYAALIESTDDVGEQYQYRVRLGELQALSSAPPVEETTEDVLPSEESSSSEGASEDG